MHKNATKAEQRGMARAVLEEMICDTDAGRLSALRPRPAFRLLLQQVQKLVERDKVFEVLEK
jgi:hypothetical protein